MRWNHLLQLSRAKAQTMAPSNGPNTAETDRRTRHGIGWWKPSRNTDMYTLMDTLDVDRVLEKLLAARTLPAHQAALSELEIRQLCMVSREIFLQQPTLVELEAPVNVVGDIHGQYEDLLRHFDKCGYPPDANYLFLGDYVDRGQNSLETICLMMAYKIKYPNNFFLLRGNHESANINRIYGFYDECKRRYNIKVWKTFTDCFNCLPVAALIEGTIFCTHGGLSPELHNLEQIRCIPRPMEVPDEGLVCDLLWADPEEDMVGWGENDRGVSYTFGGDVVEEFLEKHDCSLVVRAHQVVEDGYQFFQKRKLVTVFSAPNYCGEFDNAGAVLIISEDLTAGFSILPPTKNGASSSSPDCGVRGATALSGFFFPDPGR